MAFRDLIPRSRNQELAPVRDSFADQLFGALVSDGGVDHVSAAIEQEVKNRRDGVLLFLEQSDFRAAETEDGNLQVCSTEGAFFHGGIVARVSNRACCDFGDAETGTG